MVGVLLLVYVRPQLAAEIKHLHVDTVKTGFGGNAGNKGGVAVRVRVGTAELCFINSHLAAHDDMERRRNDDFAEIVGGCAFGEKVECVQAFHHLVWFGDLNYRCEWGLPKTTSSTKRLDRNPPKERVRRMIEALSAEALGVGSHAASARTKSTAQQSPHTTASRDA